MKQGIVIKVGTSSLLTGNEQPRKTFETVAMGVKELSEEHDVALVTSGAIGFGVRKKGLEFRPKETAKLQALSAIGQVGLMGRWDEAFADELTASQVLLTARELEVPENVQTLTDMLTALWAMGAVPIVNENDAITSEEITLGDNDRLAALVAVSINARRLVLLTDQDGVQEGFGTPKQRTIGRLSLAEAEQYVDTTKTDFGTGGMATKLIAARIALGHNIATYIGNANKPLTDLLTGKSGTEIVQ
jgi:glutamate 5-kinase